MPTPLTDAIRKACEFDENKVLAVFKHDDLTESEIDLTLIGATAENARLTPIILALAAQLENLVGAAKAAQKYICEQTDSCMSHPVISKSHGVECMELAEALASVAEFEGTIGGKK